LNLNREKTNKQDIYFVYSSSLC